MSTGGLTGTFTTKSSITGARFNQMLDIDIDIDGVHLNSEVGSSPSDVC